MTIRISKKQSTKWVVTKMVHFTDYVNKQGNRVGIDQYGDAFHITVFNNGGYMSERQYSAQLQVARKWAEVLLDKKLTGPVSSGGSNVSRSKVYVLV